MSFRRERESVCVCVCAPLSKAGALFGERGMVFFLWWERGGVGKYMGLKRRGGIRMYIYINL